MKNLDKAIAILFIIDGSLIIATQIINVLRFPSEEINIVAGVLWIWIGYGIYKRKNTFRIGAIVFCSICLTIFSALLIISSIRGTLLSNTTFHHLVEVPKLFQYLWALVFSGVSLLVLSHPKIKNKYILNNS